MGDERAYRCRPRILDRAEYDTSIAANDRTRTSSPFNDGVMAAKTDAIGGWVLKDDKLTRFDENGMMTRDLSTTQADDFLTQVIGYSPGIVAPARAAV